MKNLLIISSLFLFLSCGKDGAITKSGEALGTTYQVKYFSDSNINVQQQIDSIFDLVNASMSTYIPTSKISRVNAGDSTVVLDDAFKEVLAHSYRIWKETNGYFDPTVGALVNAWGFGPGKPIANMDSVKVDSLRQFTGFGKIRLTYDGNKILLGENQPYLDFNAVAKGFTVDLIGRMLDEYKIENYLVEVGGELIAKGINVAKESDWVVAIENPKQEEASPFITSLKLKNKALASSGNYRKFRIDEKTGTKYVHTIDPTTGFTKQGDIVAISVLTDTCLRADALATGLMAMNQYLVKLYARNHEDVEIYMVHLDDKGEQKVWMTKKFSELLAD
jgi:thiamine biosynthesis lipoprotein